MLRGLDLSQEGVRPVEKIVIMTPMEDSRQR